MPVTEHKKILLHEAEIVHKYRRLHFLPNSRPIRRDGYTPCDYNPKPKIPLKKKYKRLLREEENARWEKQQRGSYDPYIDVATVENHDLMKYEKITGYGDRYCKKNFGFVVDIDLRHYEKIVFTTFLQHFLLSVAFRFILLIIVSVNAVIIGIETYPAFEQKIIKGREKYFEFFDVVVLATFCFEIFIKFMYDFRCFWGSWLNLWDLICCLVIIYNAAFPYVFAASSLFKAVRICRTIRSIRAISRLEVFPVISFTIYKSCIDMSNILMVLLIFMVAMAISGVVIFDDDKIENNRFLSTFDGWFVVFICITQDGWVEILEEARDTSYYFLTGFYLIFAVMLGAFVFSNLIVAVVVSNLEQTLALKKETRIDEQNALQFQKGLSRRIIRFCTTGKTMLNYGSDIAGAQRPSIQGIVTTRCEKQLFQKYLHMLLALEQNCLEASLLEADLTRCLGVMISLFHSVDAGLHKLTKQKKSKKTNKQQPSLDQQKRPKKTKQKIKKKKTKV